MCATEHSFLEGYGEDWIKKRSYFRKNVYFHLDLEGNPIYWDTYVYAALNPNDK